MVYRSRALTHSALASPSRVALIDRIRNAGEPVDAHHLARECNLHVTTVRFHLDSLMEAGLITSRSAPRNGRGRPRLLYSAVTEAVDGPEDSELGYRQLSHLLLEALEGSGGSGNTATDTGGTAAERAEAAGRAWADRRLTSAGAGSATGSPGHTPGSAASRLGALFTELGFEPDVTSEGPGTDMEFTLHACPFEAVARVNPGIVCRIHLGLLRGTLDRVGAPGAPAEVEPWVTPTTCRARVGSTAADGTVRSDR